MAARLRFSLLGCGWLLCTPLLAGEFGAVLTVSAERLRLAEAVAASKYARGAAVEDRVREAAVIEAAVRQGAALGLDAAYLRRNVAQQIEANKWIQYALLAEWRASGGAPEGPVADLQREVRPQLDRLQLRLLEGLAGLQPLREQADCPARLQAELFAFAAQQSLDRLQRTALLRALDSVCAAE